MRFKAAIIIIVIAFVITAVNLGSSLTLTRNTLDVTMSLRAKYASSYY